MSSENQLERLVNKQLIIIEQNVSNLGCKTNLNDLKIITEYMYKKECPNMKLDLNYYNYLCRVKTARVIEEVNFLELTRQ